MVDEVVSVGCAPAFCIAATVSACEESTAVAMSSSRDVAASSLSKTRIRRMFFSCAKGSMSSVANWEHDGRKHRRIFNEIVPFNEGGQVVHVRISAGSHGCDCPSRGLLYGKLQVFPEVTSGEIVLLRVREITVEQCGLIHGIVCRGAILSWRGF